MTLPSRRIPKRTAFAVKIVKHGIVNGTIPPEGLEDYINDVAHLVTNRPGIEGHAVRVGVKNEIWKELRLY